MQEISLDAKVFCIDGECGRLSHIIIDENSKKVTHLAVKNFNPLASHQYLVPIESVLESSSESIQLSCKRIEVFRMPAFTEMHFFNPITSKYESLKDFSDEAIAAFNARIMCFDSSTGENKCLMRVETELIPAGEIAVTKGASIEATDGHIGFVEKFVIDPNDKDNTHLLLEEGHLWHKKELTLPLSAIAHINEDRIYLNLDKKAVRLLPEFSIEHLLNVPQNNN